ncbi:extracellular solute-binding protein [Anaerocolumna sp. AGMB13025]|uniref:extracellular solute-binding protein n=1 Tax=Anaerocolumna sp. AGMB13025 TaxID=3039116 RepID=UPI00241EBC9C|nr:extracellular solute-binding protein [Anaerocolumna sp. AGMB13025]WFR56725.1 extracellular solute-binding protein [Anaerocolumna sp. AGMB13025]
MKRILSILLSLLFTLSLLSGCSSKPDAVQETGKGTNQPASVEATAEVTTKETAETEPVQLTIWHDGDESIMAVMEEKLNDMLQNESITVQFSKKTGLTDQLKLYGNDSANGPDMYFYAQDPIGTFSEMGILAPITDFISRETMSDLLPMTLEAGNYKDMPYQLPMYFETLLFIYNKDLWKGEIPTTTEELYEYMTANTDTQAGTYAVVNQHSTAYNVAPFINGFGGSIINQDAVPGLNLQETKDAVIYNKKFASLEADGDYNTVGTLFNEGKASAIIGGPWLIAGMKSAGINLGFKSLSDFILPNGKGLAPYSGVQGFSVLKYAAVAKKEAIAKVLEVLSGPEISLELAKKSNCAPANIKAYEDIDVAANEMITAIKDTAETAVPMPNIPEVSVMWGPTESFLATVNKSGEDVDKSANQYQQEALTAIADMQ